MISQAHGYTIFSTVGAFYLPTILMLIIYAKIKHAMNLKNVFYQ